LESKLWKSVHVVAIGQITIDLTVIDLHDLPMVVLLRAHPHRDAHPQTDHHLRVHNLVKNVQREVVAMTAPVQRVKSRKAAKSTIHAAFALLLKSAINQEFVHVSLNLIFQKISLGKS
jgi:hypothetical protein